MALLFLFFPLLSGVNLASEHSAVNSLLPLAQPVVTLALIVSLLLLFTVQLTRDYQRHAGDQGNSFLSQFILALSQPEPLTADHLRVLRHGHYLFRRGIHRQRHGRMQAHVRTFAGRRLRASSPPLASTRFTDSSANAVGV